MTAKVKSLAKVVVSLPPEDRTYLAERLLASLEEADLEQHWIAEAKRRINEIRSGSIEAVPAREVYRRIDRLLGK